MEQQNHSQRKYNDDLDTVILDGVMNLEVEEELREKEESRLRLSLCALFIRQETKKSISLI